MANELFATRESPVLDAETKEVIRMDELRYRPVLKTGFSSGSDYAHVNCGCVIYRIEGGFFGPIRKYVATGVELLYPPDRPVWLVIVALDECGQEVRLLPGHGSMTVASGDRASAFDVHNNWRLMRQ